MSDLIDRQAAIGAVHKSIYDFFDICDDDEESPMTYKDKLLLELNKAITNQIKAVVSAQPVEAKPIKRGQWVNIREMGEGQWYGECNRCWHLIHIDEYCSNCGAKMDG